MPIAITGTGLITSQGLGVPATWAGITTARNTLAPWQGLTDLPTDHPLRRLQVAACPDPPRPPDLPARLWHTLSRTQQLACVAADEALHQAQLPRSIPKQIRAAVFLATTVCGMDKTERFYATYRQNPDAADVQLMRRLQPHETLDLIARRHAPHAVLPPQVCLTTCVGSSLAIAAAADAIAQGYCDLAIAGGSEALCRVVLSGFHALKVVAPDGCRPFDQDRPGITVGEGAGILILESLESARRRGITPLAYLLGAGVSCDAHHLTAPDPKATHAIRAIHSALRAAGLDPEQIDYVNAHGTGTRDNDAMETTALRLVFCEDRLPPVSSTKRSTGHTFGAAGTIEAILCVQALREGLAPVNAGSQNPDPALDLPVIRGHSLHLPLQYALSTNFAFGGNNTALIFARSIGIPADAPFPTKKSPLSGAVITAAGLVTDTFPDLTAFADHLKTQNLELKTQDSVLRTQNFVLDPAVVAQHDTITQLLLRAAHQALSMANLLNPEGRLTDGTDTALIFVSAWGTIDATVAYLDSMLDADGRFASPRYFSRSVHSSVASLAAIHFGLHGPCETLCFPKDPIPAALQRAARLLAAGRAQKVLIVFAEQSAAIAVDLARRAVTKLHRKEYQRYVDNPLGYGAIAFLLESASFGSPIAPPASPHPPRAKTVFPMDAALAWVEDFLIRPPSMEPPAPPR